MRSKTRFRFLLCMIFATIVFIGALVISIAKHESDLRERHERRLYELIKAQEHQQQRQTHLNQICYQQFGRRAANQSSLESMIESIHSFLGHFIVDDTNKLIYCFVPKVASTNWKRVLLALSLKPMSYDYTEINPLYIKGNESHVPTAFRTLSQYNVTQIAHKLKSYLKFMFARHPYERLLSAYRNKLEHTYSDYFRNRFGRKIVKQFRPNASNDSLEKGHDVSFNEFLAYVSTLNASDHHRDFNEHWRPVSDLCLPCLIEYDVIGKYETLHSDAQLILYKAHVLDAIKFPKREETYSNQPTSDLLWQYYSNVSNSLMSQIATVYSEDLQLFQYDPQAFSDAN